MHDPLRVTPWTIIRPDAGKVALYQTVVEELDALLHGEADPTANAANAAAAIYHSLPELNWVGFYFLRGQELVLGPFQGKPACVRIPLGKGVCGTAAAERRSVLVADVQAFPGHIACDADSRSELVVPLFTQGGVAEAGRTTTGRTTTGRTTTGLTKTELSKTQLTEIGLTWTEPTSAGVLGVLDLDSPRPGRFDAADQAGCEAIAGILARHLSPR
jgi:L-methionine (R)-S-oxide reductase